MFRFGCIEYNRGSRHNYCRMSRSPLLILQSWELQSRRCHFVEDADIQASSRRAGFRKYDLQITALSCPTEKPICTHKFILSNKAGKVTADAAVQCNAIHKKIFPIALPLQYLVRISWARFSEKKAGDSHHQVARLTQLNNNATHITFCPAQICTNIQTTSYYLLQINDVVP